MQETYPPTDARDFLKILSIALVQLLVIELIALIKKSKPIKEKGLRFYLLLGLVFGWIIFTPLLVWVMPLLAFPQMPLIQRIFVGFTLSGIVGIAIGSIPGLLEE